MLISLAPWEECCVCVPWNVQPFPLGSSDTCNPTGR
jgi:hypothetical protein